MTPTSENKPPKLIHAARLRPNGSSTPRYLFLRQTAPRKYAWYLHDSANEQETPIEAETIEEAMRLANRQWKREGFSPLRCGFRYTMPERDEHGLNALFSQMSASYGSMNGVYFDEELGNNCFVQNASIEALDLWRRLKQENRL